MSTLMPQPTSPADRVADLPKIQEALGRGVRDALRRHKQARNPVATWRDGQVVWVAPEEIPVDEAELPVDMQATQPKQHDGKRP